MDVVLRAFAISFVVFNHAFSVDDRPFELVGGMNILILLSGMSFARFNLSNDSIVGLRKSILNLALHILVPCLIIILLTFAIRGDFVASEIFFYQNWVSDKQYVPYYTWYPQALLQSFIILTLIFSLPGLFRNFQRRHFLGSIVAICGFVLICKIQHVFFPMGEVSKHIPSTILWQFAVGWLTYFVTHRTTQMSPSERIMILLFVLGVALVGFGWDKYWLRNVALIAAMALLIFVPRINMPKLPRQIIMIVSQATFTIFLFHNIMLAIAMKLDMQQYDEGFHLLDILKLWAFMMIGSLAVWILCSSLVRAWRHMMTEGQSSPSMRPIGSSVRPAVA